MAKTTTNGPINTYTSSKAIHVILVYLVGFVLMDGINVNPLWAVERNFIEKHVFCRSS